MRQILVSFACAAFLAAWVFAWGVLATGRMRFGWRYLRLWLAFMAALLAAGAIGVLIVWPFLP